MIAKNKKIKALVCVRGQTGAQESTGSNFNKYILKSINADLAISVAERKNAKTQMYKTGK